MTSRRNDLADLGDRSREIADLNRLLAEAGRGDGAVAVVSGGVGAGKSALLAAVAGRAREKDFIVLRAGGSYSARRLRLAMADRVLKRALMVLEDADLYTPLTPMSSPQDSVEELERTWDRNRDNRIPVVDLFPFHLALTRLAERTPILLTIDDIHWADPDSLFWLSTLVPWVERAPIMLLIAQCTGERGTDPALVDEVLARCRLEIRPGGLDLTAITALLQEALGRTPDPGFAEACQQATGGNPLFLHAFVDALANRHDLSSVDPTAELGDLAARGLTPMVNTRLRWVSADALPVARALAVLDQDADLERIGHLAGVDTATVATVTESLADMGLVHLDGPRPRLACPLLRQAIVRDVPFPALQELQVQASRLIHEAGADDERVAERLLDTQPIGELWTVGRLRGAAAAALESGRIDRAVAYLQRALREPLTGCAHAAVLGEIGGVEARRDPQAAIRLLSAAMEITEAPDRRARLALGQANLLSLIGRDDEALALVTNADGPIDDGQLVPVIRLWLSRAATAPRALQALDQWESADGIDDPLLLSLLATRACWTGGSRARAATLAFRTSALAQCGGDVEAYLGAVGTLVETGHLDEARERCDALIRRAGRCGHLVNLASARSLRSTICRRQGSLEDAVKDARTALELSATTGADHRAGASLLHLARLAEAHIDGGDIESARELFESSNLTGMVPATWAGTALLFARGRARLASGDSFEAVEDLRMVGERLTAWRLENVVAPLWRSALASALVEVGSAASACRYASEEVARARKWGAPGPLGVALRALGTVIGGDAGMALIEESVTVLTGSGDRGALFQSLLCSAAALAGRDDLPAARRTLHTALDLAERCRSASLVTAARDRLAAAGGRRGSSARTGMEALTRAEREVVALAATGSTNREIAKRQFVGERTVELHLTNAYRKLGISGRPGLAAAIG